MFPPHKVLSSSHSAQLTHLLSIAASYCHTVSETYSNHHPEVRHWDVRGRAPLFWRGSVISCEGTSSAVGAVREYSSDGYEQCVIMWVSWCVCGIHSGGA